MLKCDIEFLRYNQFETVCNCHLYVVCSPICCLYSHTELLIILYMTAVDHTNCLLYAGACPAYFPLLGNRCKY